jgi:hypothetical protein
VGEASKVTEYVTPEAPATSDERVTLGDSTLAAWAIVILLQPDNAPLPRDERRFTSGLLG